MALHQPGTENALATLRWATEVATDNPDALKHPPPFPNPDDLCAISPIAVRRSLDKLLLGRYTQHGLDALLMSGVLNVWLPELKALVGFGDGEWHHKDLWKHSKQVVWQSAQRLDVRWGALLHDIGKVKTRRLEPNGKVHFFGHSEVGAAIFLRQIAPRLEFEENLRKSVHFLILYHLRASQYDSSWTDSAVRRFTREMGEGLEDLLDLSRADITSKRPGRRKQGLQLINELSDRVAALIVEDAKLPLLPKGIGNEIMKAFAIPPSRRIGDIKKKLERFIEKGQLEPQKEPEYYLAYLMTHKENFELE